jgi:hypothetical protein|tara:strand:+ start:58 stop:771 length:714 start_codon:yes stop_codon:yes gene_type:complete
MACNGGSTTFANSGCITQADYIVARESFLRGRGTFNLSRQGTQAQKSAMAGPTMPPMAGISLGGILKGAGRIATGLIPGTLDDRIFDTLTGGGSEPTGPTQSIPGNFRPQGAGCDFPAVSIGGRCVDPTAALPGGRPFVGPKGGDGYTPFFGRYGVAVAPEMEMRTVSKCPPGWVLGDDGQCYDHLARGQRMWNPGAKPLLTGGEMSAINKAARAAKRLGSTQKKLKAVSKTIQKVC